MSEELFSYFNYSFTTTDRSMCDRSIGKSKGYMYYPLPSVLPSPPLSLSYPAVTIISWLEGTNSKGGQCHSVVLQLIHSLPVLSSVMELKDEIEYLKQVP